MSTATTWGTTADERHLPFPCDAVLSSVEAAYYRGITVQASPAIVFRWLCQMRVASYSYGRRSPQELLPGVDELAVGQKVMGVFELIEFERDRSLTLRLKFKTAESRIYRLFVKEVVESYLTNPQGTGECRLLVKLVVRYRRGPAGWLMRLLLPLGDLVMTRRQLTNFKRLSEQTARTLS